MVATLLDRSRRANTIAVGLIVLCGLIAAYASVELSGTKTGTALALVTTVGPALLYAAIVAPLAFPFGAYAMLTPLNNILDLPAMGTLTRLLGIAAGGALLFYMVRTRRFAEPPRAIAPFLLLYLWMAASMFWAIDVQSGAELLPTALQLLALYIVVSMMPMTLQALRQVVGATVLGGIVSALFALYTYERGTGLFHNRLIIRTDTSSLNPDHFAASLIVPIAICLVAIVWTRSLWARLLAGAGLCAMLATLALSGSRAAFLGLAAAILYLFVRDRHRWGLAAIGVALGAIAIAVSNPAAFFARWALAGQNGGAGRVSIWNVGWIAFKQNWLFGAGYGNFPFAYDRAFMQTFQPFYANWHRGSHNILLGTTVELGIVGLILLLLAWLGQFRILRGVSPGDVRWPIRLALEASLVGLFICGMFADIMIQKYLWLAFMLVVMVRNTTPSERTAHAH